MQSDFSSKAGRIESSKLAPSCSSKLTLLSCAWACPGPAIWGYLLIVVMFDFPNFDGSQVPYMSFWFSAFEPH